jgi:hypothetical protein
LLAAKKHRLELYGRLGSSLTSITPSIGMTNPDATEGRSGRRGAEVPPPRARQRVLPLLLWLWPWLAMSAASACLAYTFASAAARPSVADVPTGGQTPPGSNYAYSDMAPWNAQPGPAIPYSGYANASTSLGLSTEGGGCDITALHARCVDRRIPGN